MKKMIVSLLISLFILLSLNITSFANDVPFTRGSFCSKIVELLDIEYVVSNIPQVFDDVPVDDENYEAITIMYMLGCISPDYNGTYRPNEPIYKSEAIAVLVRVIFGEFTVPDNIELSDHWCAKYAWKAKESGIIYDSDNLNDYAKISDLDIEQIRKYAPYDFNIEDSGICGENSTWKYTQDGILTINGKGRMTDYVTGDAVPWYGKKYFKVIIEDGVETIGNYAFYESELVDVSIPQSVYGIGNDAFSYCRNLEEINFPENLEWIGAHSFYGCSNLTEINISENVYDIESTAFRNCSSLKNITVDLNNENYWDVDGVLCSRVGRYKTLECYPIAKEVKEYIIPDEIQYIGDGAFVNCLNLQKVTFSSTVDFIGDNAFENCTNLSEINLNEGLYYIYANAFGGCTRLESVEIPGSVKSIYTTAFRNCNKLSQIIVDADNEKYCDEDGILFSKDKKTLVRFSEGKSLKEYTVPDSVQKIENDAFYDCEDLEKITLSNNVEKIGQYAFSGCEKLLEINLPVCLTNIENGVFSGCKRLTNVEIPQNVTSIGSRAFSCCSRLKEIVIPSNVVEIKDYAFEGCYGLEDITICEGVTTIGKSAFDDCDSLVNVYLPQSVVSIGENAFRNNSFTLENKFFMYALPESYAKTYALLRNLRFVESDENVLLKVKEENGNIVCDVTLSDDILKDDSKIVVSSHNTLGQMEHCTNNAVLSNGSSNVFVEISENIAVVKIFVWKNDCIKPLCGISYIYL